MSARAIDSRMRVNTTVWLLVLIVVAAASVRLFMVTDWHSGVLHLTTPCNYPFVDEIRPLVESKNLLHFEVFFYPPVAPMVVALFYLPVSLMAPGVIDLGRFCSVLTITVDVGTLLLLYFVGREWGVRVGLVAAAFYAVTMVAVVSTGNVQIYSTFFVMLAFYYLLRSLREPSRMNLVLMGGFLGLAVATKYFPAFLFLMLFAVHFEARQRGISTGQDNTVLPEHMQAGRSRFAHLVWHGALLGILLLTAVTIYVGLFHREWVMDLFRAIYDRHSHEHAFEYHVPVINRLFNLGLISAACLGVLAGVVWVLPYAKGILPVEWARDNFRRNQLWLFPCMSMVGSVIVALGIPAVLNLNNYVKYAVFTGKAYASTDGGMFPAARPAPSYFLSFFPESLGRFLFVLACLGLIYCLLVRERRALLIMAVGLPLYIMLELSSVKVNRYALDLMPLFCLFAGLFLVRLWDGKPKVPARALSLAVFLIVMSYSAIYSLAWANFYRADHDIRVETTEWLKSHVPPGSRLGTKSSVIVSWATQLLPETSLLSDYELTEYTSRPEYILLPKLVYSVVSQYSELAREGITYTDHDWFPYPAPDQKDVIMLVGLVAQTEYNLIREFEKGPSFLGLSFSDQNFGRQTWFIQHTGPYAIQIYRRRTG